jgi:hypothetical protein
VLTVTIGEDTNVASYTWDPATIDRGAPVLMSEPERSHAIDELAALTPGAGTCA